MQIREAAKKILCIRNVYQKDLGRGKATTVASLERYGDNAKSDTVHNQEDFSKLTEAEQKQIIEYLKGQEDSYNDYKNRVSVYNLCDYLNDAVSAMESGVDATEAQAISIHVQMDKLQKLLKKQGFNKRDMLAKAQEEDGK